MSEAISRDRYLEIKKCIHLADNQRLKKGDKMAKVNPMYDLLNKSLQRLGIFHKNLSIDESMVPYFGNHSGKMFIRGKPIRFGYKLWVLTGNDGFPYHIQIYSGRDPSIKNHDKPLGYRVVDTLLKPVRELSSPSLHTIHFDNFFTSYSLLTHLKEQKFKATGI